MALILSSHHMYLIKTPYIIQLLLRGISWRVKDDDKVYLTFDDGPIPEVTPWILDLLKEYHVKSTFFCVGENVVKNPDIYSRILRDGHSVGNHTFHHLNAWNTPFVQYIDDVKKAREVIDSKLFRPPYGKITPRVKNKLKEEYKIVMWSVLSGDFDTNIDAKTCYDNVVKNTKRGSIIVLHDNDKSFGVLKKTLPKILDYFAKNNITLAPL